MSIFRKLFGENNAYGNGGIAPALRTVRVGGYDKSETLTLVDALNMELYRLAKAVLAAEKGQAFEEPPRVDFKLPEKVRDGGFSEEDVESFVRMRADKITELRKRLAASK